MVVTYRHLPASGLGIRDPLRPYVTGGLGAGVPLFVVSTKGFVALRARSTVGITISDALPGGV